VVEQHGVVSQWLSLWVTVVVNIVAENIVAEGGIVLIDWVMVSTFVWETILKFQKVPSSSI